ncbi:synaptic vesicle glycoprotein 2B-like [Hyposmocoma kahamanoa]|uniref:synaptic vesicle glycoprotein 2B-like n=1 Tax=Hyposmocoma kahamanoa TaxID=1477025 RepID=UPI000E6DA3BA|nr:synaptic vesicle glycoprotein 2B-like [Hyposmocoma kahamanoa]
MDKRKQSHSYEYETALELTGFGKYNVGMLVCCCLLILAMFVDMFGFSVVLPSAACDLQLTTSQQGLLSAIPLIGVMVSSYTWGLCADTLGRRKTLLIAMPIGMFFNLAASIAPTFDALAALKFFSASFTSSANAAAFVLLGESIPRQQRSRFMFLMASATMCSQLVISLFSLSIVGLTFRIPIHCLALEFRPWRLLMLVICSPGILGIISLLFLHESPKFLLSKKQDDEAMRILKSIHSCNIGSKDDFKITTVYLEETQVNTINENTKVSFVRKMWNQTAPLFKPPLLKNSLIIYYLLLCAYMTSTGFTMWIPTMTNAYFNGKEATGKTLCEVASTAARKNNTTNHNCDNVIPPITLYSVMVYSGAAAILNTLLSFIVKPLGKKKTTLLVFILSILFGISLLFLRVPLLSIAFFYLFLYVSFILGNMNTYLVELNPTHLRGMATCLSVVVARGSAFISVQLIAELLADHCHYMFMGYVALVISGLIVAMFLPPDTKNEKRREDE